MLYGGCKAMGESARLNQRKSYFSGLGHRKVCAATNGGTLVTKTKIVYVFVHVARFSKRVYSCNL
jgi:hypothetical protein